MTGKTSEVLLSGSQCLLAVPMKCSNIGITPTDNFFLAVRALESQCLLAAHITPTLTYHFYIDYQQITTKNL